MSYSSESSFDFGLSIPEESPQFVSRDSNTSGWLPQSSISVSTESFSLKITNPCGASGGRNRLASGDFSVPSGDNCDYNDATNILINIYAGEDKVFVNESMGVGDADIYVNNKSIHFGGDNIHDSDSKVCEDCEAERNMIADERNLSGDDTDNHSGGGPILTDDDSIHDGRRRLDFYDRTIYVGRRNDHRPKRNIDILAIDRNRHDGDINILNSNKADLLADRENFGCRIAASSDFVGFSRYRSNEISPQTRHYVPKSSDSASSSSDCSASSGQYTLSSEERSVMHRLRCVWPKCGRIHPLSYCQRSLHVLCEEHTAACGLCEEQDAASHICVRCGSRMTQFNQERLRVVRQFIRLLRQVNAVDERGNVTHNESEDD